MSTQNSLTPSPGYDESAGTHKHFNERFWGKYLVSPTAHHPNICIGFSALQVNSHLDSVMVDSGAAHSACPADYAKEHKIHETQRKIQFQTANGELLGHHMAQDSVLESRTRSLMSKGRLRLCPQ